MYAQNNKSTASTPIFSIEIPKHAQSSIAEKLQQSSSETSNIDYITNIRFEINCKSIFAQGS